MIVLHVQPVLNQAIYMHFRTDGVPEPLEDPRAPSFLLLATYNTHSTRTPFLPFQFIVPYRGLVAPRKVTGYSYNLSFPSVFSI